MKKLILFLFAVTFFTGCNSNDPTNFVDPAFSPVGKTYSRYVLQSALLSGQASSYLFYVYTFTSATEVVKSSVSIPNQPVDINPQNLNYEFNNPEMTFKNKNGDITEKGKFKSEKAFFIGSDCYNLK